MLPSPLAYNVHTYHIIQSLSINTGLNLFKPSLSVFSKNIPTRYTTGSVKTSLNYINPKPIIYSQRSFDRANQSSNPDKVDHSLPSGIQSVDLERHSLGSSPLKIVRHSTNKNVIIKQRSFDIANQSSKPGRVAYPLQSRIQAINKKRHSLGSSPQEMVLRPSIERDMVSESADTPLLLHRDIKNIGYENKFKESWKAVKSILRVQPSNKEMRFWKSLPTKMVITEKDRISKHTDDASSQKNSNLKITIDGNILKDSRETIENISIPAPYPRTVARIALSSKNPAILNYLQRSVNTYILNTSYKLNKAANSLLSGIQPSDREKRSSGFPLIKTAIWPSTDKAVSSRDVDTPLLQQNTGLKNISYRNTPGEYEITRKGSLIHPFNRLNIINNLQYANTIEKRRASADLKDVTGGTAYSSKELILNKPVIQKTDITSEDKEHLHDMKTTTKMRDNLIEPFKQKPIYEINTIADKVYKIIERKISIEKDRRGLF
ncbi:hypothetical protein ANME2D_02572 [Candidatus Methanoperedens nitroreducens]|uniref:Uncharacterized protein n=2 Tax=Candidatus Methanoperedens nitratireducens TaxID=1392998 RepID=A0A062UZH0_9EURY|nr:hypothetical protein ANME2D_02572 [Candidatus Methanoperedens nitroreducens]